MAVTSSVAIGKSRKKGSQQVESSESEISSRPTLKSSRTVSNLTPEELERKRAKDREHARVGRAQRKIRMNKLEEDKKKLKQEKKILKEENEKLRAQIYILSTACTQTIPDGQDGSPQPQQAGPIGEGGNSHSQPPESQPAQYEVSQALLQPTFYDHPSPTTSRIDPSQFGDQQHVATLLLSDIPKPQPLYSTGTKQPQQAIQCSPSSNTLLSNVLDMCALLLDTLVFEEATGQQQKSGSQAYKNHPENTGLLHIQALRQQLALLEEKCQEHLPRITCSALCRAIVEDGGSVCMESTLGQGGTQIWVVTAGNPHIVFSIVGQPLGSQSKLLWELCGYIQIRCEEAQMLSEEIGWVLLNNLVVFSFPSEVGATLSVDCHIWTKFIAPALRKMNLHR